jgi:hypothetical protein
MPKAIAFTMLTLIVLVAVICAAISFRLMPAATRVAVLVDPANATYAEITVRETGAAARSVGLQIQVLKASTIG